MPAGPDKREGVFGAPLRPAATLGVVYCAVENESKAHGKWNITVHSNTHTGQEIVNLPELGRLLTTLLLEGGVLLLHTIPELETSMSFTVRNSDHSQTVDTGYHSFPAQAVSNTLQKHVYIVLLSH